MQTSETPPTNHSAYKWLIDELVDTARDDISAKRIREDGHPERTNHDSLPLDASEQQRKKFFLGLSPEQKEMLAEMFDERRYAAVHDIACFLEWALSCDEIKMERKGERIPCSPFNTMHHDFVARFWGDPWPDEDRGIVQ